MIMKINLAKKPSIQRVAILGSGVMGGQIAAVFANANIPTLLFDYQKSLPENISKLTKIQPSAFTQISQKDWIKPCYYETDLTQLRTCDLVIEAVIETLEAKLALFELVLPHLSKQAILASNTSSLSINTLADKLGACQPNFCGIHFFNPPRYMPLVELIASKHTKPNIITELESFLTAELGKNIIHAQDCSGFIANRIGVFSIAAAIKYAQVFSLGFDTVDVLTGVLLHRSKSASFRTADVVGLDILHSVFAQFHQNHTSDPWRDYFLSPDWLTQLIERQHLGNKTQIGIYQKNSDVIEVYQPDTQTYVAINQQIDDSVLAILKQDIGIQISQLKNNTHPQAQFLYALLRDTMLYSAYHLETIAHSTRDIDWALHWGFGWDLGLFEYWQANNVQKTLSLFQQQDSNINPAHWLNHCQYFYQQQGAYSPAEKKYLPYLNLAIYKTQLLRPTLLAEPTENNAVVAFENPSCRCWHQQDGMLIFSIKTKLHTLNLEVIQSLETAISLAEAEFSGLIIWQNQAPFCAGANLYEILAGAKLGLFEHRSIISSIKQKAWHLLKPNLPNVENILPIAQMITLLQDTLMHLKHSRVPSIAAVEGLAIGGGCELLLHCDRVVAAQESYIGLVEAGVGLLPSGGGCKEMALRASKQGGDFEIIAQYFQQIALGKISTSAQEARTMGYLQEFDVIISQPLELLYHAKKQVQQLLKQHYRPSNADSLIAVSGLDAKANILAQLTNMSMGHFISDYDYFMAEKIADTLCGGELETMTKVDAKYLLKLERQSFIDLVKQQKTQDRIEHMLIKHKPLRN